MTAAEKSQIGLPCVVDLLANAGARICCHKVCVSQLVHCTYIMLGRHIHLKTVENIKHMKTCKQLIPCERRCFPYRVPSPGAQSAQGLEALQAHVKSPTISDVCRQDELFPFPSLTWQVHWGYHAFNNMQSKCVYIVVFSREADPFRKDLFQHRPRWGRKISDARKKDIFCNIY